MSVINTNAHLVVADPGCDPGEPVAVDQFIARVLRRAHRTAESVGAPDEARAILHVAQLFADDLAETDPQFDRLRFIEAATRPSEQRENHRRKA
jgi:hypothetical protein